MHDGAPAFFKIQLYMKINSVTRVKIIAFLLDNFGKKVVARDIVEKFGVSQNCAYYYLKAVRCYKDGIDAPVKKRKSADEMLEIRMYVLQHVSEKGLPFKVSKKFGITQRNARNIIAKVKRTKTTAGRSRSE